MDVHEDASALEQSRQVRSLTKAEASIHGTNKTVWFNDLLNFAQLVGCGEWANRTVAAAEEFAVTLGQPWPLLRVLGLGVTKSWPSECAKPAKAHQ